MTTNIYVLRLAGGRFYVGKTSDPMQRYAEHLSGHGSAWTRKYRPVGIERIIEKASPFDEDKITKEYMARHGIEKVRGGSYVSIELDDIQQESLQREIWAASDCCTTCGRKGHFAAKCYASTDVFGNQLESDDDDDDEEEVYWECCHCKKLFKDEYTCTKHENTCKIKARGGAGISVSSAHACYRCGRKGHYASSCYAVTSISGGYLLDDEDDDDDY